MIIPPMIAPFIVTMLKSEEERFLKENLCYDNQRTKKTNRREQEGNQRHRVIDWEIKSEVEMKEVKTIGDIQYAFESIPESKKDYWADCFWSLYSHNHRIFVR